MDFLCARLWEYLTQVPGQPEASRWHRSSRWPQERDVQDYQNGLMQLTEGGLSCQFFVIDYRLLSASIIVLAAASTGALAQKKYDTGATDTEIKIGNIMPYSGPASAYGVIGKTEAAYFKKINAEGGINGRKIKFISYDDAYSPPKTVEQARKLVESDEVLLIFGPLGTAPNSAIQKYMNEKKVPQLFIQTGAAKWNDPKQFPWTMGWVAQLSDRRLAFMPSIF